MQIEYFGVSTLNNFTPMFPAKNIELCAAKYELGDEISRVSNVISRSK